MSKIDDAQLEAELNALAAEGKTNFTFAEAQAAAGEETPAVSDDAPAKPKRAAARSKGSDDAEPKLTAPRTRVPAGASPSEIMTAHLPAEEDRWAAAQLEEGDEPNEANFTSVMSTVSGLAKKIIDKGVNVLRHRKSPNNLQVYTRLGLEKLIADGHLTSKGMVAHYQDTKYTIGTARAQTNQIMTLFPALKIAKPGPDKGTIVLNENSAIVRDYREATRS